MTQYAYLGEAGGARIIRHGGHATQQVTTANVEDVLLLAETWDVTPAGEAGEVLFRMALVTVRYTNGFHIQVTPVIDGDAKAPQTFSGAGIGTYTCEAWLALRGASLSLIIEQLARTGDLEIIQAKAAGKVIREVP